MQLNTLFGSEEAVKICGKELTSNATLSGIPQTTIKRMPGYYIRAGNPVTNGSYRCRTVYMVYMEGTKNEKINKNKCKLLGFWINKKRWMPVI